MNNKLDLLNKIKPYSDKEMQEIEKQAYISDRNYPENFSNWYNCIESFGCFSYAKIIANQIFTLEETQILQETDNIEKVNWGKICEILKPTLDKLESFKIYNIKNGCFSNKFDFDTCMTTKQDLAKKLWKINYMGCMYDTGGFTELVVREPIPNNLSYPTIYNGMPLREEIRVFYNIDKQEIEYIVDYWDYIYCYENLNATDKIIFNWFHNKYDIYGRQANHKEVFNDICQEIKKNINTLKFTGLTGIWSIDFLYELNENKIYLIDMARGFRSAYWDPEKLKNKLNTK